VIVFIFYFFFGGGGGIYGMRIINYNLFSGKGLAW